MPKNSSDSVNAIFLDRERALSRLRELARDLREADPRVVRVVLFGSLARGRATPRSDADLLIVLEDHDKPIRERVPEYLEAFLEAPLAAEVVPLTREELDHRKGRPMIRRALEEGIDLLAS